MPAKIFLYPLILIFLFVSTSNCGNTRIAVTGTALNAKAGAVLETSNGNYYVDGLNSWDEQYYGKKVKVTGKLILVTHEKQSTDSMEVQEIVGTISILKKPKWQLAE